MSGAAASTSASQIAGAHSLQLDRGDPRNCDTMSVM
jgi:hypothetical protein